MSSSGCRRALVIGIDDYPHFEASQQLFGAVADARAFAAWLIQDREFAERDVEVLLNGDADRKGILGGMARMSRRADPGDTVVFYYSGHGSQMTDREGDEGDGLDETLVPYDSGRDLSENRDVTDDEIHRWASEILSMTMDLILIFDCCHSGTLHRPGWQVRAVPPDLRPIAALPPSPMLRASCTAKRDVRVGPEPLKLSACGDEERALEAPRSVSGGEIRGAFTFNLLRTLDQAGESATWRQIMEKVTEALQEQRVEQHPEGSGQAYDDVVFSRPTPRGRRRARVARWLRLARTYDAGEILQARLYRSSEGPWQPVTAAGFREGDRLRIDLEHRRPQGVYLYALDLGVTDSIDMIFPDLHGHELVDPRIQMSIGARPEDTLELYLPDDFPTAQQAGAGYLLLVASEKRLATSTLMTAEGLLGGDGNAVLVKMLPYRLCR